MTFAVVGGLYGDTDDREKNRKDIS